MNGIIRVAGYGLVALMSLGSALSAQAQNRPPNARTEEQRANDNKLFISLENAFLRWEEPAEPVRIRDTGLCRTFRTLESRKTTAARIIFSNC